MPIRNDSRAASGEPRGADPMADHKRRSRWRLFGSFILIGAVALVAPIFLEDEARNLSDDLLIQMPARTVALEDDQTAETADQAPASASRQPSPPPSPPSPPSNTQSPQLPPKPALPNQKAVAPAPVVPTPVVQAPATPQGDLAAVSSVFYVQVGAYASLEAAGSMKKQLESLGHAVLIQAVKVAGGADRYRVRVGPFKNRQQAEEMMGRVKEKGFEAVIVNPV
jgi:DedD protein